MYSEISGLKQVGENQQEKVSILIKLESVDEIRNILKDYGIVILGVKKYSEDANTFGDIRFKMIHKENEYEGIVNKSNVAEGFKYLFEILGLNIVHLNSIKSPLEEGKIFAFIENYKQKQQEEKKKQMEKRKQEMKKQEDKKLVKFREFINSTVSEADELLKKTEGKISGGLTKQLNDHLNELKKIRMGSNIDKLSETFEILIKTMETIEMEYLEAMKEAETLKVRESVVSELDIVIEYEKYKKAQKIRKVGNIGKVTSSNTDLYYKYLGKMGIYAKLMTKDIYHNLGKYQSMIYHSFEYFEVLVIFMVIELMLYYMFYKPITGTNEGVFNYLWMFGLLGMLIYLIKMLRKNNLLILFGLYLLIFISFWFFWYLIWSNFGL